MGKIVIKQKRSQKCKVKLRRHSFSNAFPIAASAAAPDGFLSNYPLGLLSGEVQTEMLLAVRQELADRSALKKVDRNRKRDQRQGMQVVRLLDHPLKLVDFHPSLA